MTVTSKKEARRRCLAPRGGCRGRGQERASRDTQAHHRRRRGVGEARRHGANTPASRCKERYCKQEVLTGEGRQVEAKQAGPQRRHKAETHFWEVWRVPVRWSRQKERATKRHASARSGETKWGAGAHTEGCAANAATCKLREAAEAGRGRREEWAAAAAACSGKAGRLPPQDSPLLLLLLVLLVQLLTETVLVPMPGWLLPGSSDPRRLTPPPRRP